MTSFTLDHGPAPLTQDQVVIECLTRYVAAADALMFAMANPPNITSRPELIRLMMEIGRAKGDAQIAGYLWPT
jgi:hypothetical protein